MDVSRHFLKEAHKPPALQVVHVIDGNDVRWMVKIQLATRLRHVLDIVQSKYGQTRVMLCIDGPLVHGGTIVDPAQTLVDLGAAYPPAQDQSDKPTCHRLWVEPL